MSFVEEQTPAQVIQNVEAELDRLIPGWRDKYAAGRTPDDLRIAVVRVRGLVWLVAQTSPMDFIRPAPQTPDEGAQAMCALARMFIGGSPPAQALAKLESAIGARLPDWRESLARDVPDSIDELRLAVARMDAFMLLMSQNSPLAAFRRPGAQPAVNTPEEGARRLSWLVHHLVDGWRRAPDSTAPEVVALTNEALPHVQYIGNFITAAKQSRHVQLTREQFQTYVDRVEAFRAIRNRAPECEIRETWDLILREHDALIRKTRESGAYD